MAVVGNLPKPRGLAENKLTATQASVTGTGAVTTGLSAIVAGGVSATVTNSGTTTPWTIATVSSIVGGTVNVVVLSLAGTPTIGAAGGAQTVAVIAIGS